MNKIKKMQRLRLIDIPGIIEAVLLLIQSMVAVRKLLAKHSIRFFAWYYLQLDLWDPQVKWAAEFIKSKKYLRLAPRGHGKSELTARILVLWLICNNRDIRILLVSKEIGLARKHVISIKDELRENTRIITDYGKFYAHGNKWTETQIKVIREKKMKDNTLEAIGLGGTITGSRFDYEIFDDIIETDDTNTDDLRAKTREHVYGTLIPLLEPWGYCWAIGTRKHFDDIYNTLMKDMTWRHSIDKAIIQEPESYEFVRLDKPIVEIDKFGNVIERDYDIVIKGNLGKVLCDEKWDMKSLLIHKKSLGSNIFSREYQNEVVDDETSLFPLRFLEQCYGYNLSYVKNNISEPIKLQYKEIFQGCDPSLIDDKKKAELKKSDYMVILTVGIKEDGHRDLLGMVRERGLTPAQVETKIKGEYERFFPYASAIEVNSFGLIHGANLINNTGYKFVKHITTGNKNDLYQGVPSLSVLFENAKYSLPYKTDEDKIMTDDLVKEFHGLGSEPHDDIVMAFWILETLIRRYLIGQSKMKKLQERQ